MADLERFMPDIGGDLAYEHRHRYFLCGNLVRGKSVLDVACGEGYGSEILARHASRVVGLDNDAATVEAAVKKYASDGKLEFKVGDCASLPFADATFDVVVSFETIEHIEQQESFVREVARVLRPDGVFIVSTPNRPVYTEETGLVNTYHLHEFDETEFRGLLGAYFKRVRLFGQRFFIPSVISELKLPSREGKGQSAGMVLRADLARSSVVGVASLDHAKYFLAICSNSPVRRRLETPSFFFDEKEDLWRKHERIMRWASGLHSEDEILRARLRESEQTLMRLKGEAAFAAPCKPVSPSAEDIEQLTQELATAQQRVADIAMEMEKATAGLKRAEARADAIASEQAITQTKLEEALTRATAARAESARHEKRVKKLEKQAGEAAHEKKRLEEESANVAGQLEAANAERKQAEDRADAVGRDLRAAESERDALRVRLAETAEELKTAQAAHAQAKDSGDAVGRKLLDAEAERDALNARLAKITNALNAALTARKLTEARIVGMDAELKNARESATHARRETEVARAAAFRAAEEFNALQEDLKGRANQVLDLNSEVFAGKEIIEKYVAAASAHKTALQRLEQNVRVVSFKHRIDADISRSAHLARAHLAQAPLQLVAHDKRLKSSIPIDSSASSLGRWDRKEIEKSGLFDAEWYLSQNHDVAHQRFDPLAHFLKHGFKEDRDPHPYFCSSWYRALYASELDGSTPLLHYLRNGKSARHSPHPLFDARHYLRVNRDVAEHHIDPLAHFIEFGEKEHRDPHPLIWVDHLSRQPGFTNIDRPVRAYLSQPHLFLSNPHPLFDGDFYLHSNDGVRLQGICPLLHYCAIGWRAGHQPHRAFSGDWYLAANPDVLAAQINPLEHFVCFGTFEERSPHPLFDISFYLRRSRDARKTSYDAFSHFMLFGAADEREINEKITLADMKSIVPEVYWRRYDPISAFMAYAETRIAIPPQLQNLNKLTSHSFSAVWPPQPETTYWLPQKLRDYIIDRYGESQLDLYIYLMYIVDLYGDRPEQFHHSSDLVVLHERLKKLCAVKRSKDDKIDVSIIVPVYNNLVFTLTSIISVMENESKYSYEIIIADDQSKDPTPEVFADVESPVAYVRHPKNLGFLKNCNAAAKVAKGDYIVFLNNDTLALPNWLDELIGIFERDDRVGMSGSKLLNADGTLQEAGGIFWSDGSAWNFGRNRDPRLPEFNYQKDTDYISGASIALPTRLWKALNGFDTLFTPAYCEDSDLAFRVREEGFRVVYVPHSEIVHHEGKSHGRDTSSGIKAYQIANQEKLLFRWRATLESRHFPNAVNLFLARDRSRTRPHVLIVDHYVPQWDRDAGSRTMYHFIRMFLDLGFHVTFWPDNLNEDREYCRPLQAQGVEVIYSAAYLDQFEEFMATNGKHFDCVLLSRPHIAIKYYAGVQTHSKCPVLYYGHDIHYKRLELEYEVSQDEVLLGVIERTREQELVNWRQADVVLYPSAEERDEVRRVLRNVVAAEVPMLGYLPEELSTARVNVTRFPERDFDELLFVGGSHPPNIDALVWFATEVMPLILTKRPKTRLNVVGSTSSQEVARLGSDSVILRGRLSDEALAELYAKAGVAVIPLRFGGGVKGKTIEALYHAIPFVTTTVGMQGLFPEKPISYVADDGGAFADAVLKAQSDRERTFSQVERGVAFIDAHYSIEAMKRAFAPFVPQFADTNANEALTSCRSDDSESAASDAKG